MKPLLLLGYDGLDPRFIEKHQDVLPHFQKLLENNALSDLSSTTPPITKPAWISCFTGRKPEKLDRLDFQRLEPGTYTFSHPAANQYAHQEFWNFLRDPVVLFEVPAAPIRDINGWILSKDAVVNPLPQSAHPETLAEEIEQDLGDITLETNASNEKERRKNSFKQFEARKKIADWFLNEKGAGVYFFVFRLPDNMMHHTNKEEHMLNAYKACDTYLGELMERDLNIILLSDHGAILADHRFSLNTWLRENEYLATEKDNETSFMVENLYPLLEPLMRTRLRDTLVKARDIYRNITGKTIGTAKSSVLDQVNWEETAAFSFMSGVCSYSGIWINDERFPRGQVTDRDAVQEELITQLSEEQHVAAVKTKDEAFTRDAPSFPDLLVELKENVKIDSGFTPTVTGSIASYMHRKEGVLGVHGPDLKTAPSNADLIDIAPTVLHYFGEAIPRQMDGEVLDIFADTTNAARQNPRYIDEDAAGLDI